MVNGIRTMYPRGLNKGFAPKFYVGSRVRHETTEECRMTYRSRRYEYNNKDKNNSPNTLNNRNY